MPWIYGYMQSTPCLVLIKTATKCLPRTSGALKVARLLLPCRHTQLQTFDLMNPRNNSSCRELPGYNKADLFGIYWNYNKTHLFVVFLMGLLCFVSEKILTSNANSLKIPNFCKRVNFVGTSVSLYAFFL